jgi:hypothetical protein
MTNKKRIIKLERRTIPPGGFLVVWADPEKEGIYYDRPNSKDRITYTDKDLEPIRQSPQDILFVVRRDQVKP